MRLAGAAVTVKSDCDERLGNMMISDEKLLSTRLWQQTLPVAQGYYLVWRKCGAGIRPGLDNHKRRERRANMQLSSSLAGLYEVRRAAS
jgi:hypothetical protein